MERATSSGQGTSGGGSQQASEQAKQQGQQLAQRARQQAGQLANRGSEQVKSQLGSQKHRASQRMVPVQSALRETAHQLRSQGQGPIASVGFQRMLRENPLTVGALAAGLGAGVGLAIPETTKEHEVMGEARDNLVGTVQEKAQDAQQRVQRVAEEAQSAAKGEAENQGLTNE